MSPDWDMPVKASGHDDAWGGGNATNGNGDHDFNSGGLGDGNGADLGGGNGGDDRACYNCGETGLVALPEQRMMSVLDTGMKLC